MRRSLTLLVLASFVTSGCLLDRSSLSAPDAAVATDGGRSMDSGAQDDAGARDSGSPDAEAPDAGPPADAGPPDACAPSDRCDGADDDCDPATIDGSGDPDVGTACDGDDADVCEDDVWICAEGALRCEDVGGDAAETACDGRDNDCDGVVDEGADECAGCERRERDGRSYLFCRNPAVWTTWFEAGDRCRSIGYELTVIEDDLENDWITARAREFDGTVSWWIGLSDHVAEGTYVWDGSGTATAFTNWNAGENPQPNDDIRPTDEDFVYLESNEQGTWFDNFQTVYRSICEAGP